MVSPKDHGDKKLELMTTKLFGEKMGCNLERFNPKKRSALLNQGMKETITIIFIAP
jgi:hypothetical protein